MLVTQDPKRPLVLPALGMIGEDTEDTLARLLSLPRIDAAKLL